MTGERQVTGGSITVGPEGVIRRERFYDEPLTAEERWWFREYDKLSPVELRRRLRRAESERDDWKLEAHREQSSAAALRRDLMDGFLYTRLTVFNRVYVVRTPKDTPDAQAVHTTAVRAALVRGHHDEADSTEGHGAGDHVLAGLRAYDPGPMLSPWTLPEQFPVSYAKDPGKAGRKVAAKYENVTFEEVGER